MAFVGIVTKQKEFEILQSVMKNDKDRNIILITDANIESLRNVNFDTVIIDANMENWNNMEAFDNICKYTQYIAVNTDNNKTIDILKGTQKSVITYGLHHKCTITVSSISEELIMIAVQREILSRNGNLQEIGEEKIKKIKKLDIYGHMIVVICNILYGKFTKN